MAKIKYIPRSGVNAGKRNFKKIRDYLKKYPNSTGAEISEALNLSLPTVYGHLKKFQCD